MCCSWQPPHFENSGQRGVTLCAEGRRTRSHLPYAAPPLTASTFISACSPSMQKGTNTGGFPGNTASPSVP